MHYITSDIYEAAFYLMVTQGECRPTILVDSHKNEALFSYKDIDPELPVRYHKSDIARFKILFVELKREMFRILDGDNGKLKKPQMNTD